MKSLAFDEIAAHLEVGLRSILSLFGWRIYPALRRGYVDHQPILDAADLKAGAEIVDALDPASPTASKPSRRLAEQVSATEHSEAHHAFSSPKIITLI